MEEPEVAVALGVNVCVGVGGKPVFVAVNVGDGVKVTVGMTGVFVRVGVIVDAPLGVRVGV